MAGITVDQLPAFQQTAGRTYLWRSAPVPPLVVEDCPDYSRAFIASTGIQREIDCTGYWSAILAARNTELQAAGAPIGQLLPILSKSYVQTQGWPDGHFFWALSSKPHHGDNGTSLVRKLLELGEWVRLERNGHWSEIARRHDAPPPIPSALDVWCAFVLGFPSTTAGFPGKTVIVHYCLDHKIFSLLARAHLDWLVPALGVPLVSDNARFFWSGHPSYTGPAPPPDLDLTTVMQTPRLNEKAIMKAGLVKMQIYRDDFIKDPACNLLGDPPNLRFVTEAPQAKPQLQHPVQPQPQYPSGNIGPFQPGMGAIWPGMGFGQPQLPMQPQQPQPQGMFAPFGVEQPQPQPVMGFGQPQPPMQPQQPQQQGMFDPFGFGQPQPQPSPSPQFPMFGYNTGAGNANVPLAQPQPQSQRQALFLHPDIQENLNNGELLLQQPVFPLPIAGVPYDEQQENHADVMEFEDEAPHLPPAQPFGEEDPLRRGVPPGSGECEGE